MPAKRESIRDKPFRQAETVLRTPASGNEIGFVPKQAPEIQSFLIYM